MRRRVSWVAIGAVLALTVAVSGASVSWVSGSPPYDLSASARSSPSVLVAAALSGDILAETGLLGLKTNEGLSGAGVTVGIVDTGIDPAVLASGAVSGFVDLSPEGKVKLSEPLSRDAAGTIEYEGSRFTVRGVKSVSGAFRVGFWSASSLPGSAPALSVLKGLPPVAVLAADNYLSGQYDTVYIDTNGDRDFSNEKALEVYRNSKAYASLPIAAPGNAGFTLLVSDITDNGRDVVLGFDAHGHGTEVASILVGAREGLLPVSPSVSIIAVKALDSAGESSWDLVSKGISAAIEQGASIVVVSASPRESGDSGGEGLAALTKVLRDNPKALIVLAAGNDGPGIGTLPSLGKQENLIVAGGYVPASAAKALSRGSRAYLWPWSSRGPDRQGNGPSIVAPAAAPALPPAWSVPTAQPPLFEGTSCSAAYVGGTAALLAESMMKDGKVFNPGHVRRSIEDSGVPVAGAVAAEQGHGAVGATGALSVLRSLGSLAKTRAVFQWNGSFVAGAFFDREKVPGQIPVTVDNLSPYPLDLHMALPSWMDLPYQRFGIAAVDQRQVTLGLTTASPGIYSDFVSGDDADVPGTDLEFMVTSIVPRLFDRQFFAIQTALDPGEIHREFLEVPAGLESLKIALQVNTKADGVFRGRAALYVYDGSARLVHQSQWLGAGASSGGETAVFDLPSPGVWEAVVVSDPSTWAYVRDDTFFKLEVVPSGIYPADPSPATAFRGEDGGPLVSTVRLVNPGDSFAAEAALVVPGQNGFVRDGEIAVTGDRAATIVLPRVEEGTRLFRVAFSPPSDGTAVLSAYLWFFDTSTGQWREIRSTRSTSSATGEIVMTNPQPGQYVAYIDVANLSQASTRFRWLAVTVGKGPAVTVAEAGTGSDVFQWPKGGTVTIRTAVAAADLSKTQYLLVWDNEGKTTRAFVPITPIRGMSTPVVTVGQGSAGDTLMNVTLKAWERGSMKPVDACVEVDGAWYQLSEGHASLVIRRNAPGGLRIRSEYPGMVPWTNIPQ